MKVDKLVEYLESSFLKDILVNDSITDISYNGKDIFYMSNDLGRRHSDICLSKEDAKDFVRQIANLSEKSFSYQNPFLDVSFNKYRFNATHDSVSKVANIGAVNFSIRIASNIKKPEYITKDLLELLTNIIIQRRSIIISGKTGCGKTQLQKYLISLIEPNTRVIVIDNVEELTNCQYSDSLDFNFWCADETQIEKRADKLIRNALRCNPDWLILAEARGSEMVDILTSAMTGHPIITTIHSYNNLSTPHRIARMIQMSRNEEKLENILNDVFQHIQVFIHLSIKKSKEKIVRYIDQIMEFDNKGKETVLYEAKI